MFRWAFRSSSRSPALHDLNASSVSWSSIPNSQKRGSRRSRLGFKERRNSFTGAEGSGGPKLVPDKRDGEVSLWLLLIGEDAGLHRSLFSFVPNCADADSVRLCGGVGATCSRIGPKLVPDKQDGGALPWSLLIGREDAGLPGSFIPNRADASSAWFCGNVGAKRLRLGTEGSCSRMGSGLVPDKRDGGVLPWLPLIDGEDAGLHRSLFSFVPNGADAGSARL